MCGRYTISRSMQEIADRFDAYESDLDLEPNYNVAPTQMVPVVIARHNDAGQVERVLQVIKWGLIPFG